MISLCGRCLTREQNVGQPTLPLTRTDWGNKVGTNIQKEGSGKAQDTQGENRLLQILSVND